MPAPVLRRFAFGDQALLLALGTHALIAAVSLGWEIYVTDAGRFMFPEIWPVVFLAAWVACAAYHRDRTSSRWWQASGVLLLAAYTSRAAVIFIAMAEDAAEQSVENLIPASLWLILALSTRTVWLRVLVPLR